MRRSPDTYNPTPAVARVLDAALTYIEAAPYAVGLRWVFYRLLQDGYLDSKEDYAKLKGWASTARKRFYNGWHPDTLVDEGRKIDSPLAPSDRKRELTRLHNYVDIIPDLFEDQDEVPLLVFEAATMSGQFEYFAPWADRAAFRGDASIPHKWNIAKRCDALAERYDCKPIHILYFGDLDPKGLQIPKSAMADVFEWIEPGTDLYFTRCGINPGDASRFNLPEKSLKPGTYEWESLSSKDAGVLIREGLNQVVDLDRIESDLAEGVTDTENLRKEVFEHLQEIL